MHRLRHFLLTCAAAAVAGAVIGVLAGLGDWSSGVIFGVGMTVSLTISLIALKDILFAPGPRSRRDTHLG